MSLFSTQVGVIGENLLVNAAMKARHGRLSPFGPVADAYGLDVLLFDRETGGSVANHQSRMTLACKRLLDRVAEPRFSAGFCALTVRDLCWNSFT
ncbi:MULTISPECIES: hypothetical protein [Burkholderia]|uniref:hypothetical protein n=1 Tax=Burkholderia TaxID=32008 RepID=UPI00158970C8|nr:MULTISPECIES: hypothetical protein [Burkholderia]MDN7909670.1 hypothetical protein [Burkholderia cepacia]